MKRIQFLNLPSPISRLKTHGCYKTPGREESESRRHKTLQLAKVKVLIINETYCYYKSMMFTSVIFMPCYYTNKVNGNTQSMELIGELMTPITAQYGITSSTYLLQMDCLLPYGFFLQLQSLVSQPQFKHSLQFIHFRFRTDSISPPKASMGSSDCWL